MTTVAESLLLDVPPLRQPDDVSCGPTCLTKVLHAHGDTRSIDEVAAGVRRNPDGGTLAVYLAHAALDCGYDATIFSYNLHVFDPTWTQLTKPALEDKLRARAARCTDARLRDATTSYADFVARGGTIRFDDLDPELLIRLLHQGHPVIVGLSATYLYQTPRENPLTNASDDVGGEPGGHFVVVCGYEANGHRFVVSDPYRNLPMTAGGTYEVETRRLLNAILLGHATSDAVLLVVTPRES